MENSKERQLTSKINTLEKKLARVKPPKKKRPVIKKVVEDPIFKKKLIQLTIRAPVECKRDFKIAITQNMELGHRPPQVLEDLLNYYVDFGLPPNPEPPEPNV